MINKIRIIVSLSLVIICSFTFNTSFAAAKKEAEYTLIIYLNGCDLENGIDSDRINKKTNPKGLKAGATNDVLNELRESSFDDRKLNVIVITGGTNEWLQKEPAISTTQCQAWRIYGPDKNKLMEKVKETPPSMYMMNKETLSDYISWAIDKYPAKKYALFLWGHGGGPIGGFGVDQLNKDKSISISDMQEALKKALKGKQFDLIAFIACLMGNFETAYKLKDCGKYMVASEELEFDDCFEGIIKGLSERPDISGKDLGRLFIDAHFNKVKGWLNKKERENLYTFSVIDLAKISDVKNKWDNLIQKLEEKMKSKDKADISNTYRSLAIARGYSESYNEYTRSGSGLTDLYEFSNFISLLCNINTDELQRAIKDCVIYNKVCEYRSASHGLSVFFVDRKLDYNLGTDSDLIKYEPQAPSKLYSNFISCYYNTLFVQNPSKLIGEISFIKVPIKNQNPKSYPPVYFVDIDPGSSGDFLLVNQIFFVIGKLEGSGSNKVFKTLCIDKDVNNDLSKLSIKFTGNQYCIGGKPIAIYWDGNVERWKNPKYIPIGSFAVKHKGKMKFLVVTETKPNVVKIIDTFDGDYSPSGKVIMPNGFDVGNPDNLAEIKKDPTITILYKVDGNYVDGPEVKLKISKSEDGVEYFEISKSILEDGEYCGAFYIEDVIGRGTWSFQKIFNIKSSKEIKTSDAQDSNIPMPANQSL